MPYITDAERNCQRDGGKPLRNLGEQVGNAISGDGDLQYVIAVVIQTLMEKKGLRYAHCRNIMGDLIGAIGEFKRCVVDPYEAQKAEENGPVYDLQKMRRKGY